MLASLMSASGLLGECLRAESYEARALSMSPSDSASEPIASHVAAVVSLRILGAPTEAAAAAAAAAASGGGGGGATEPGGGGASIGCCCCDNSCWVKLGEWWTWWSRPLRGLFRLISMAVLDVNERTDFRSINKYPQK